MKIAITGADGFIGGNISEYLQSNHDIIKIGDDYNLAIIEDMHKLEKLTKDVDIIIHCAGHADVRNSHKERGLQFNNNVVTTRNVLELMLNNEIDNIVYLSTAVVNATGNAYYDVNRGDFIPDPTSEDEHNTPKSLYGTTKLMAEELIKGYVEVFGLKAQIFRLENIAGQHYTHGVIIDFIEKLKKNDKELEVLGNGQQTKSYLHVDDVCAAIAEAIAKFDKMLFSEINITNIGNIDTIKVSEIAKIVTSEMRPYAKIKYTEEFNQDADYLLPVSGFQGDIPIIVMTKRKMLNEYVEPTMTSEEVIRYTTRWLLENDENN